MLMAALRDLQWRRRRFIIAILGTAVVFAMTLVLTGLANGFRVEAHETVDSLGIDTFIVRSDAAGPFVGSAPFPADQLGVVVQAIHRADAVPLVYSATLAKDGSWTRSSNLYGGPEQGPGMPPSQRPATVEPVGDRGIGCTGEDSARSRRPVPARSGSGGPCRPCRGRG